MKKYFYNDYDDFKIIEYQDFNRLNEKIGEPYYKIKFAKIRFGIKYYSILYEEFEGLDDIDYEYVIKYSILDIKKEYNNFVEKINNKLERTTERVI